MKYRITKVKSKSKSKTAAKEKAATKEKPYKLTRDPEGDDETLGTYGSIQAAKEKLRHVVCKGD